MSPIGDNAGAINRLPQSPPARFTVTLLRWVKLSSMGAHDGAVDHGVFVVGVACQKLEHPLPHAALGPARKASVYLDRIAKALRQITPRDASSVAVENRFHEQPVVLGRDPDMAVAPRQHVLDPIPLIVSQPITTHRSAPIWLTVHESHMIPRGNPVPAQKSKLPTKCSVSCTTAIPSWA